MSELFVRSDMRKGVVMQSLTAEVFMDCGNLCFHHFILNSSVLSAPNTSNCLQVTLYGHFCYISTEIQFSSVILYMHTPKNSDLMRFPPSILTAASPQYYQQKIADNVIYQSFILTVVSPLYGQLYNEHALSTNIVLFNSFPFSLVKLRFHAKN